MGSRPGWQAVAAFAALGVAIVGVVLPWAQNPLASDRDGWTVLTGRSASTPVTLLLFVAVAAAVVGVAVRGRWAVGAAAVALGCLGWYGAGIATDSVRSIGMDIATGNMVEPEASTRLGVGWYVAVGAVLAVALAGVAVIRRRQVV
jgi:hypothetical protein